MEPSLSGAADAGRLLVVCKDDARLEVVDLALGRVVGAVAASGVTPHEVAATLDGRRAFLPIYSDASVGQPGSDGRAIDVIDLATFTRIRTVSLEFASRPHLPVLGGDGRLYVSTELDRSISIFDADSVQRVGRLPTGARLSHMFALTRDCRRAYSANVRPGTVSVMDVPARELVSRVALSAEVNRICLDPDERLIFCADQTSPRLAVIEAEEPHELRWVDLPGVGFGSMPTLDGRKLVIALRDSSAIGVLDLDSWRIEVIDVPPNPQSVVVHPAGRFAYSACDHAACVVEVDLWEARATRQLVTGRRPDGLAWACTPP